MLDTLVTWAPPTILAITLHEVAHGRVARLCGDDTAARLGRLSLNPLRHIDPVGTLLIPALLLLMGAPLFGWARPVPVDMSRLRQPRRDMALVALAGPLANLAMLVAWLLMLRLSAPGSLGGDMAQAGVLVNLVLMLLNLLPFPPLDGSRVLSWLLPLPLARAMARIEPYGLYILIVLMATGVLATVLDPLLSGALRLLARL